MTADSNVNVLAPDYLHPSEGPTFIIGAQPPKLAIEINERVIAGIESNPDNFSKVRRAINDQLNQFLAKHVSWIAGVYDGR